MSNPSKYTNPGYPLVTVVIPTYNRLQLLLEAIQSVLAQTYPHWELIIVDDGSSDATVESIHLLRDSRIRVIASARLGHIGELRNIGVKAGYGKWLAFLDSDDVWMPKKLETQLKEMQKKGTRWSYGRFELMDESGQAVPDKAGKYYPLSGRIVRQILRHEASVTICSVIVERTLFEEIGGFSNDPRLLYRGDYELELRLALQAEATALPDLLVRVREHTGRVTHCISNPHEMSAMPYDFFLALKPGQELERIARYQRGYLLAEAAKINLGNRKYARAFGQLIAATADGDRLRHLLSSFYGGVKTRAGLKHKTQKITKQEG